MDISCYKTFHAYWWCVINFSQLPGWLILPVEKYKMVIPANVEFVLKLLILTRTDWLGEGVVTMRPTHPTRSTQRVGGIAVGWRGCYGQMVSVVIGCCPGGLFWCWNEDLKRVIKWRSGKKKTSLSAWVIHYVRCRNYLEVIVGNSQKRSPAHWGLATW